MGRISCWRRRIPTGMVKPYSASRERSWLGLRRSLLNHQLTSVPKRLDILLFCGFYRNKVNTRTKCCLANCRRNIGIIFPATDKSFYVLCGDESDSTTHRGEGSPPEMRSGAGLHSNKSSRFKLSDSIQQFRTRDFLVPCNGAIDHPDAYLNN